MKPLKFRIKQLGAIRDSEVELKELMVFSGESGLGKSYVAFLIHYLYKILRSNRINDFFPSEESFYEELLKKDTGAIIYSVKTEQLFDWINKDAVSYIGYCIGQTDLNAEVFIDFPFKKKTFDFVLNHELGGLNNDQNLFYQITLEDFRYRVLAEELNANVFPYSALIRAVLFKSIFGEYLSEMRPYLMPPSRGGLMEIDEKPAFRSGMYDEFFLLKSDLNRALDKQPIINQTIIDKLEQVNVGDVKRVNGNLVYYTKDGTELPLTAAASSIKELAPLTLLLKKYPTEQLSILLEEPEAHLHPDRQVRIADLIASAINNDAHIQITSHSDFLIKRLNVLMALYHLKMNKHELYERIKSVEKWNIDNECVIDPAMVGAYLLKSDGNGNSIIEKQELIDGIPFDSFEGVIDDDLDLSMAIREAFNEIDEN